jgi:hypothetical protein
MDPALPIAKMGSRVVSSEGFVLGHDAKATNPGPGRVRFPEISPPRQGWVTGNAVTR